MLSSWPRGRYKIPPLFSTLLKQGRGILQTYPLMVNNTTSGNSRQESVLPRELQLIFHKMENAKPKNTKLSLRVAGTKKYMSCISIF